MSGLPPQSAAFSGLPQPFLDAMRKLFEILDKEGCGWIHINDISTRWNPQTDQEDHLPKNIVENLHKVVNAEGKLSFERFCAGLKIAILRHESEKSTTNSIRQERMTNDTPASMMMEDDSSLFSPSFNRTNSLPNLFPGDNRLQFFTAAASHPPPPSPSPSEPCPLTLEQQRLSGPPKPPRDPIRMSGIFSRRSSIPNLPLSYMEGEEDVTNQEMSHATVGTQFYSSKRPLRRRESHLRRHTLQGGVDVSMMKRLKQWEEEKTVLEEGLKAIEACHHSYSNRLRDVQDKLKFGADPGSPNSEAMQERLMFELQSIRELNYRLRCLAESGRPGGFPSHINLQVQQQMPQPNPRGSSSPTQQLLERQVARLKQQNRMLTEEVGRISSVITNMDKEKSALIKQLFQARSMGLVARTTSIPSQMGLVKYAENENTFM